MNISKGKERWIDCYKSSQKILLVGEGDFSFSACLARAFRTAENIVATSYLKRELLLQYHWTSIPHLEELERLGCLLLYKIDVYKMHTHPNLKNKKFDIIIFNFPHAGHFDYLCEHDTELIAMHKELVEAYFKSASKMLTEGGEVHLRHRDDPPYDSWNVVLLASKAGLTLKEKFTLNIPKVADLSNKDEVHVLKMKKQVHGDEIQVSSEEDDDKYIQTEKVVAFDDFLSQKLDELKLSYK
ncbi:hypothetical protein R6Q59_022583 [Mikania micrantha]|uniref:25S rRNA (uridine-N(3))-methyltransferase BMT5-like domain-containing protein n=1 Tax=Mikania micrantha TaxID=192012 RepID=A0A5N6N059_9ASTR|nr:hypothetical protein E3N88_27633 [Mikania micrantha]